SDEQREILKMVADKVITVEEAERLLKALDEGSRAQEPRTGKDRGGVGAAFDALGEVISDIGPMVRTAVEDAVSGIGFGADESEETDAEHLPWDGNPLTVAPGTTLEILQLRGRRMSVRRAVELTIEGVPGEECALDAESTADVRIHRHEGRLSIRWSQGDLRIMVPGTAAKVVAKIMGGSIHTRGVSCPVHLRTMGGTLALEDVLHPFDAKTMGGGIALDLGSGFHGDGRLHTMGGSITATVPVDVSCTVHAVTLGGTIEVDGGLAQVERSKAAGKQVVNLSLGTGPVTGSLALKTMGGSITVRRTDE
ncbi:hypothetical protein JXA88_15180, partial [Candidatus Fermentibacteria bacterium]|nr:hypothetical protein [Candidatus Fermentibacteria bacterium]